MSVFVHAQGMKTVHAGGGSKNGKILYSVHVVVEFEKILAYMAGLTMTNLSANLV